MTSFVMGRPEEERMHAIAMQCAPLAVENFAEYMAKRKKIVVAVELHNVNWRSGVEMTQQRFLWLKANGVSERFSNFTHAGSRGYSRLASALASCRSPLTKIHRKPLFRQSRTATSRTPDTKTDKSHFELTGKSLMTAPPWPISTNKAIDSLCLPHKRRLPQPQRLSHLRRFLD